uniref:UPAR/Ly6 domain-containing protein n=1 Tax=Salmo trutta TaxID=8032 RepID=A0A674EJF1_SALTR
MYECILRKKKNLICFSPFALLPTIFLSFHLTAESLHCNTCSMGITSLCLFGTTTTCSTSEPGVPNTITASILGAGVTSSFSCCQTDLCNGASSVQVSVTVALSAALMAWGI